MKATKHPRYVFLTLIALFAAACTQADAAATADPQPIALAAEPIVSIGGTDPRPEYSFDQITGGLLLPEDQGFVILDTRARQVRLFGTRGEHITSFGREGTGPGEFRLPVALAPAGADSIHVWDLQQRRLTTLSVRDGGFRSSDFSQALAALGQPLTNLQGILRDGTLVVRDLSSQPPADQVPDGIHRFPIDLLLLQPSGPSPNGPLATLPGDEMFHLELDGRANSVAVILGLTSPAAARGDRIAFGANEGIDLRLVDGRGDALAVLSSGGAGRAAEQEEIDSLRNRALAAMDAPGFRNLPPAAIQGFVEPQKERIRRAPARQVTPAFDLLRIDSDERTWVRRFGDRRSDVADWLVYDRGGALLGIVAVPFDLQLMDARSRQLLAMRLDELDVPTVLVYEILWP
jgi:hypothetical protein